MITTKSKCEKVCEILKFAASCALILIVVGLIAWAIVTVAINAQNRITEGVIIDKRYLAAYYDNTTIVKSKDVVYADNPYHPARYYFTIRGEKNEKIVEYSFQVTETQYNSYNIGDYFKL